MVLLNLLVKPIYIFTIDRNVQEVVGYENFGLYAALLNLTIIFNILLDLGITSFNNKSIAEKPERINTYLPNMLIAKGLLSLVFAGVILLVGFLLGYDSQDIHLLYLIVFIQLLNSLLLFLRSNVSAHHDFKIDSFLSISDKLIMIAICGFLLYTQTSDFVIEWFIYTQIGAYAISVLIALGVILIRYTKIHFATFDLGIIKKIIKKSLPFAVLILLMGVYTRGDTVLLNRLLNDDIGDYENGIYASAYRVLDALNMFGFLFAGMLLPIFSRLFVKNNRVQELVKTTVNILIPISLAIAANALFFNADIMNFLYSENTTSASQIYLFAMLIFPAFCIMNVYSTLLTARGDLRLLIGVAIVASTISMGANIIFIPTYKALSLAYVAVVVHWFAAGCHIFFSIKKTDLQAKPIWTLQFVLFFLIYCGLNYLLDYLNINLAITLLLNMLVFVPIALLSRLWNLKELTKYFREVIVKE